MFERQLQCSAQLWFEHLEARKRLIEQVAQACAAIGTHRIEPAHRTQAFFDHC